MLIGYCSSCSILVCVCGLVVVITSTTAAAVEGVSWVIEEAAAPHYAAICCVYVCMYAWVLI